MPGSAVTMQTGGPTMPFLSWWKSALILLVVIAGFLFALPAFLSPSGRAGLPAILTERPLTLGIDLEGGNRVVVKVDDSAVIDRTRRTVIDLTAKTLDDAGIAYADLAESNDGLLLTLEDPARMGEASERLRKAFDAAALPVTLTPPQTATGDPAVLTLAIGAPDASKTSRALLDDIAAALKRRFAEAGLGIPEIAIGRRGEVTVHLSGETDPERLRLMFDQVGALSIRAVLPVSQNADGTQAAPAGSEQLFSLDETPVAYRVAAEPLAAEADITDARAVLDPANNEPTLILSLSPAAIKRFADAAAAGTQRAVLVLDNGVIAAVDLPQAIKADAFTLSGGFAFEGVDNLAALARAGPLPSPLTIIEQRTVAPGLGADSMDAGLLSAIFAIIAVALFMIGFFGVLGAIASVALIANLALVLSLLALLGIPLTLPGIAGLVLTVGMSVDANVLIYERLRDEMKAGATFAESVRRGFGRAFRTVRDAAIVMLAAGLIVLELMTGAVRGFAATMIIGLFTTLFSAFLFSRWLVELWVAVNGTGRELRAGLRTRVFDRIHLHFMSLRRQVFGTLAVLAFASFAAASIYGINLGADFRGGSIIELRAKKGNADLEDIRDRLAGLNLGAIDVRESGGATGARVRIPSQQAGPEAEQSSLILVRGELEDAYDFRRIDVIAPSASLDTARAATLGIVASLAALLAFIWVRYRWQFAAGALIATLHDIALILGLFALTGMEFGIGSVAALLTVVGYSLNDTMVVYDRIRENLKRFPKMPLPVLIDASINQTLSRTVLTSATTLIALAALFLFGGEVIRTFALTMLFGIAVATFSSIYVAGPALIFFGLRSKDSATETRKA